MATIKLDPGIRIPLKEQLAGLIRERIQSGEFPVDHRVPSKAELRAQYGCSARVADEAMKILKEDGMVVAQRGKGFYVVDPAECQT
jgi:DNA-binding GntR family transcriptional regulator